MAIQLDTLEQRIIGALIEKQLTVPDTYPLTVKALVAACNQKSNREPFMSVEDYDVEGALRSLMDKGWVTRQEPFGGRAMRYAHETRKQLGVEVEDLALLSELLCRGPQAAGALKTRASRMRHFDSPAAVEDRLRDLAERPVPFVELLPLRPRERQARWQHLLGASAAGGAAQDEDEHENDTPSAVAARASAPAAAPVPSGLAQRLADLEAEVADLRERLERLESGA
jgi:uncharacterized protein YceH (UPF0502 family)